MIDSAKSIIGRRLNALDDRFGCCRDLFFDEDTQRIVYLVADTRKWLPGRQTLLSPQCVLSLQSEEISLDITRKRIENSPPIDTDQPVSRQSENALFSHFGWAPYWELSSLADPSASTAVAAPVTEYSDEFQATTVSDSNLRSVDEIIGYKVHATGDKVGRVHDFLIDTQRWELKYLAVDTHPWIPGGIHLVDARYIAWIDHTTSVLSLRCLAAEVKSGPSLHDQDLPNSTAEIERKRQITQTV